MLRLSHGPCLPAAILTVMAVASAVRAQSAGDTQNSVLAKPPHETERRLAVAQRAVTAGRHVDALAALQELLAEDAADGFLPPLSGKTAWRTVRSESRRIIGAMPAQGRQWCEVQCGARARQLLDASAASGDRASLAQVANQYFHTDAGREALLLLARDRLDHGQPLEAIRWLHRLSESQDAASVREPERLLLLAICWLSAGQEEQAASAVEALAERAPNATFSVGQREYAAARESDALLRHLRAMVPCCAGNPLRTAQSEWDGGPIESVWSADLLPGEKPDRSSVSPSSDAVLPAARPIVVGDVVLARSPSHFLAFDGKTGERVWQHPWKDAKKNASSSSSSSDFLRDAARGQLSSDGRRVYFLDSPDPGPAPQVAAGRIVLIPNATGAAENRLLALDLAREGALVWSVGGITGEDEPALAEAFFLGPPLPSGDWLYVLAELKGDIQLCALDAASGALVWSVAIAHPARPILADAARRLAGATPSMAGGILICPTSAGAVAAVDPATRSLVWGCEYPRYDAGTRYAISGNAYRPRPVASGWLDSSVTIAGDFVLIAPVDGDRRSPTTDLLICLGLFDGEERWSCQRQDARLVACVHQGKVVLVGSRTVIARQLADGKPVWELPLENGALPTGRGLHCGRFYYLPTAAKTLLKIDLEEGRVLDQWTTAEPLGNLVAVRGQLLSLSFDTLQLFKPANSVARP